MKYKFFKDSFIIGFALFAMFFGAGNLIFPTFLGNTVGNQFFPALTGFLLTGVGLPLLGILACFRANGSYEFMAQRVSPLFAKVSATVLILAIGPVIAIPRTASTTFELGIITLFPAADSLTTVIVFFTVCLFFVLKPTSIVNTIGKFLTPGLLIVLILIIVKGIFVPIGDIVPLEAKGVFALSFREGYQTMDALAATIFGSIILLSAQAKGYKDRKSMARVISLSGIVAALGLTVIYGGLMYLGTQTSGLEGVRFTRIQLVMYIIQSVFGSFGAVFLSISAILACLTTAVALLTASASFFTHLFKERIPYPVHAIILTIVSILMATHDVDSIVSLAVPALDGIYPVAIALILLTIMGSWVKSDRVVVITVYTVLFISLLTTLVTFVHLPWLEHALHHLPFHEMGMGWCFPGMVAFLITTLLTKSD